MNSLIIYVWHYLVARVIYDQLLRPLIHRQVSASLVLCVLALAVFLVARHRSRRARRKRA
jgi:hypothetical protein